MKILMLGGTGFVGGAVLSELCRAGHHVLALAGSNKLSFCGEESPTRDNQATATCHSANALSLRFR